VKLLKNLLVMSIETLFVCRIFVCAACAPTVLNQKDCIKQHSIFVYWICLLLHKTIRVLITVTMKL
jgi:hypothetical protein